MLLSSTFNCRVNLAQNELRLRCHGQPVVNCKSAANQRRSCQLAVSRVCIASRRPCTTITCFRKPRGSRCRGITQRKCTVEDDIVPRAAVEGDIVTLHYVCRDQDGEVVESSRESEEPVSFEIGAGEVIGNKLFKAFDAAIRGLSVGDTTTLKASGGEWQRDLLFSVPKDHDEIQRLEARYNNVGGLARGLVVELANGSQALVCEVAEDFVQLDANNMLAGKTLIFELELVGIEAGV